MDTLNPDQKFICDAVLKAVLDPAPGEPTTFYVFGAAGTGKTHMCKEIFSILKAKGRKAQAVSLTGSAASLYEGGQTSHQFFHFPENIDDEPIIEPNLLDESMLREIPLIVWDNATISEEKHIVYADQKFRVNLNKKLPFGGIPVVFVGDFRQLLPIQGSPAELSQLFPKMKHFQLTQNMKCAEDPEFSTFLLQLGEGTFPSTWPSLIDLPQQFICPKVEDYVYGETFYPSDIDEYKSCVILCSTNDDCKIKNQIVFERLLAPSKEYLSEEYEKSGLDEQYLQPYKNSAKYPPHKLELKIGTVVMLVKNYKQYGGLIPIGTRLVVEKMDEESIEARVITGGAANKGEIITIEPDYVYGSDSTQLPIILGFAMTIYRAMGLTFDKVGLCVPEKPNIHGELYTALSRVRHAGAIRCELAGARGLPGRTRNVVDPGRKEALKQYRNIGKAG